jgi:hypothetical protein
MDDGSPLAAAQSQADSAAVPLYIAANEVRGDAGARISLFLDADLSLLRSVPRPPRLLVQTDRGVRAFTLLELQRGVTVYAFEERNQVSLRYSLERTLDRAILPTRFRLLQRLHGPAQVVLARRPWVREWQPRFGASATAACTITAQTTSGCDNTATTAPFVASGFLGADFQSDQGTGVSHLITIRFAVPVVSVTIRIVDSDFSGNSALASDANGQVGSVSFSSDGTPGNDAINETQTITAPTGRGISTVQLIPAANDYVAYNVSWEGTAPCAPTNDPIMDLPGWRQAANALTSGANGNVPVGDRLEAVDYVVRDNATGQVTFQPSPEPTACYGSFINTADRIQASLPAGQTLVGIVHSHVIFAGEDVSSCRSGFPPYNPDAYGGGSQQDWLYVNNPLNANVRVYAVSPERIHYLPPGLTDEQSQNANDATNGYNNQQGCASR